MWTRAELKARAWDGLRRTYWKGFLASLLLFVVTGGFSGCSSNFGGNGGSHDARGGLPGFGDDWEMSALTVAIVFLVAAIAGFVMLLALAFRIFIGAPLEVGVRQYFKEAALGDVNMNYLVYAFSGGRYGAIVKGMLWSWFLNFLWYLLLIIPGIVKLYAYSLTSYILADNPDIGTKRAVELSKQMTDGQKWRMFVLDLSFIGWYLVGALALLVGTLFVLPYVNATNAELYLALRRQALEQGLSSRKELNLPEFV